MTIPTIRISIHSHLCHSKDGYGRLSLALDTGETPPCVSEHACAPAPCPRFLQCLSGCCSLPWLTIYCGQPSLLHSQEITISMQLPTHDSSIYLPLVLADGSRKHPGPRGSRPHACVNPQSAPLQPDPSCRSAPAAQCMRKIRVRRMPGDHEASTGACLYHGLTAAVHHGADKSATPEESRLPQRPDVPRHACGA